MEPISTIAWNSLAPPSLPLQTVHVWRSSLLRSEPELTELRQVLSLDEQQRAQRFRRVVDRDRFIAARGTLRMLLGRYLHLDPAQLMFRYTATGKPSLATEPTLQFNLSHSQDWLLCAIGWQHEIGVDLEQIRPMQDLERLAQRFFAPSEFAAIVALPVAARSTAFFRYWTCKEAVLKAIGTGLAGGLAAVELSLTDDSTHLVRVEGERSPQGWLLAELIPVPHYRAAIAVSDPAVSLQFWQADSITNDKLI